jgi:hypothetical protein
MHEVGLCQSDPLALRMGLLPLNQSYRPASGPIAGRIDHGRDSHLHLPEGPGLSAVSGRPISGEPFTARLHSTAQSRISGQSGT